MEIQLSLFQRDQFCKMVKQLFMVKESPSFCESAHSELGELEARNGEPFHHELLLLNWVLQKEHPSLFMLLFVIYAPTLHSLRQVKKERFHQFPNRPSLFKFESRRPFCVC